MISLIIFTCFRLGLGLLLYLSLSVSVSSSDFFLFLFFFLLNDLISISYSFKNLYYYLSIIGQYGELKVKVVDVHIHISSL